MIINWNFFLSEYSVSSPHTSVIGFSIFISAFPAYICRPVSTGTNNYCLTLLNFYLCQQKSVFRDTGQKKRPFYFIVIADSRAPRDGKFIQKLGTYNPLTVPATIQLDRQKALEWLNKGATPTDTVRRILSFKGVLYLKHLLRGVGLGLFDDATAMEKFTKWSAEHEAQVKNARKMPTATKEPDVPFPVADRKEGQKVKVVVKDKLSASWKFVIPSCCKWDGIFCYRVLPG